jgi:hypothetical protein
MSDKLKHHRSRERADNRAFYNVSMTPDGERVFKSLDRIFGGELVRKTSEGMVDPNASMVALGSFKVIKLIREKIHDGKMAR